MLRLDSSEMLPGSQKGEEAHKFWAQPLWLSPESVVSRESALGDICVMTCTRAPSAGHSGGGSKQTRVAIMLITRRADAASPANSPDIVGSLPIRRVTPPTHT